MLFTSAGETMLRLITRIILWLPLFMTLVVTAVAAPNRASTEQVTATLLASSESVRPGDQLWLAVHQSIIPHWHTYWLNPGDSGTATEIEWTLPNGVSAGAIQWPAPTRIQLESITNYGYSDQVTLLVPFTVAENVTPGQPLQINALVKWLVCEESCIPQSVNLGLALPVVAQDEPAGKADPLITQALAALPKESLWPVRLSANDNKLELHLVGAATALQSVSDLFFYADEWGRIVHGAAQPARSDGDDLVLSLTAGDNPLGVSGVLSGVLVVKENAGATTAFNIRTALGNIAATDAAVHSSLALLTAAALAFLGGIILNLMPCVFPVLSIKALALLKHAEQSARQQRLHGVAYTGGVLASFTLLALVLIALKAAGSQIGWGFQYQSPVFVLLVALLMFAVGLSLSGVLNFGTSLMGVGSSLASGSGYSSSFFTGVLAAVVATPCTAPFMGAAIGYALSQPALQMLVVFWGLGLGLALPYLLLAWWPSLQRRLPKPGLWMEWVKQAMAFPMYLTSVWLIWVLGQQASVDVVAYALAGMVLIAFAAWLFQITRNSRPALAHTGTALALSAVLLAIAGGYWSAVNDAAGSGTASVAADKQQDQHWQTYSAEALQALRAEGKPVFLNFTAAWCISCLVNERVALSQSSVQQAFKQQNITYLKGDWTNQDAAITAKLAEFDRSGVPLYVFYPPGVNSAPQVLPQILTPDIVISAIKPTELVSTLDNP